LPQEEAGDIADARPWPKVSVEQLAATRAPGEVRPLRRPVIPVMATGHAGWFEDAMDGTRSSTAWPALAGKTLTAWKGQLFVRVNGGKTQVLHNVSSEDTVGVIRSRVRGHHRLAQWMTWAGKSLQDDRTLASYGIGKESTLTLAWRLLGGAKTKIDPQEASAAGAGVEWAPREELSEAERAAAVRMRMRSGPETHPGVPKCQEESCIREACRDLPIADLSAGWEIEALLNVMDTYPAHFGIITRACKCLAAKRDIEPGTVLRLGGIDKIVAAMVEHQRIADLQMWACTALAICSCRNRAAKVKIAEVGGIACILSAMEFFKERADVQLAACQCLLQASSESQLRGVIKELGGEGCTRRAMAAPNADASLRDVVGPSLLSRVSARNLKGTVEETAAGTAGSKMPLRQRIGLVKPRHERDVWKAKAEAPVALQAKDRNAAMDIKILCGMIDDAVRESVLCKETRIVCFLLSSTFTDTVLCLLLSLILLSAQMDQTKNDIAFQLAGVGAQPAHRRRGAVSASLCAQARLRVPAG